MASLEGERGGIGGVGEKSEAEGKQKTLILLFWYSGLGLVGGMRGEKAGEGKLTALGEARYKKIGREKAREGADGRLCVPSYKTKTRSNSHDDFIDKISFSL